MAGAVVLVCIAVTFAAVVLARDGATGPVASTPTATSSPESSAGSSGGPTPTDGGPTGAPTSEPGDGWTLEQKVGQLFMVGVDVTAPAAVSRAAIVEDHVGNLFLHGRTTAGVDEVRALVEQYTGLVGPDTTRGTPLLVATDQEGGQVQVLRGPGFSDIPAATVQATWAVTDLREQAAAWGTELASAGVDLDLAPVMDLVPAGTEDQNPPVGALQRHYGTTAQSVTSHAGAFAAGLHDAGVAVAIKHFPGLGHVTANPDASAGVTDDVTTSDGPEVGVFADGIEAGADQVMVSTAVYSRIDPSAPAAFSSVVVTDLLRGQLGFDGVVITDDLSGAEQVAAWSPGDRAIAAIAAGVDIVLVSKVPDVAPEMVRAVVHQAQVDPDFAAQVDAAFARVIAAKSS
jgi:beta-N-acetylhexosaminidase